jgi:hypothetical protein
MRWGHVYGLILAIVLFAYLSFSLFVCLWIIFSDLFAHDRRRERERR